MAELRYRAFGQTRFALGSTPTSLRFTGQMQAPELGLYDYGARFYDPALGRFIQPDSLVPQPGNPLAWDRYSYVYNNPVNRIDPSGHDPWYCNGDKNCMKNDFTQRGYTLGYSNAGQSGPPLRSQNNPPQLPQMPSFLDITIPGTNIKKSSPFLIGPAEKSTNNPYITELERLLPYGVFYNNAAEITEVMEFVDNKINPSYKQWKGAVPGGPFFEGALGFSTQLVHDINDHSILRKPSSIVSRAIIVGAEDAITDSISTSVGITLGGGLGEVCGPAAPACMIGGYFAGSIGANWYWDYFMWQPINAEMGIYR